MMIIIGLLLLLLGCYYIIVNSQFLSYYILVWNSFDFCPLYAFPTFTVIQIIDK